MELKDTAIEANGDHSRNWSFQKQNTLPQVHSGHLKQNKTNKQKTCANNARLLFGHKSVRDYSHTAKAEVLRFSDKSHKLIHNWLIDWFFEIEHPVNCEDHMRTKHK